MFQEPQTVVEPALGVDWDTVCIECDDSGVQLQFVAPAGSLVSDTQPHSLIALQNDSSPQRARDSLWQAFEPTASPTRLRLSSWTKRAVKPRALLGESLLPLVDLVSCDPSTPRQRAGLKELVVPFSDEGPSLLAKLSQSGLPRPATGLYQCEGLCLRPLPSAAKDHEMPPPSLIFHMTELHAEATKIGHTGRKGAGQYMLRSEAVPGLDVRLCPADGYSTHFAEAQESLLAGSLSPLQSDHVLDGAKGEVDPRTNQIDCWVEFRANMARPSGFFAKKKKRTIAKAPDLPFE